MTLRPRTFEEARKKHKPMKRGGFNRNRADEYKFLYADRVREQERQGRKPRGLRAEPDAELATWSRAVRERDGNKCKWTLFGPCATGDKRIDPHHIAPRGRRPDLAYVVENGICLCRTHHNWCHDNPAEAEQAGLLNFDSYELAQKLKRGYKVPGDEGDTRTTL